MIIGIAGGSGSGKTTFTNAIKEMFKEDVLIIRHDDYYKDNSNLSFEEKKHINYDHPDALETDLLVEHVKQLKAGQSIEKPLYDFSTHDRKGSEMIFPKKIIILEGILILESEALRNLIDIKVYVDAASDERILRRILRDTKKRGRTLEDICDQYLKTVRPMHEKYVEPTRKYADIIINGGMNKMALELIRTKMESVLQEEV